MRTYHQVQSWLGNDLPPEDWGYTFVDGFYRPVRMIEPPAPSELLKIIKCNCLQNCNTKSCTCKKFNLFCSVACGHYRGIACCNRQSSEESSNVED